MDAFEVKCDAERCGNGLRDEQGHTMAEAEHHRRDQRIRLDAIAEGGDADVGEDAVKALRDEERDDDNVAERQVL